MEREGQEIIDALRSGLVPRKHLHRLATGLEDIMGAIGEELDFVATGRGASKWIRGE